MSHLLKTIEIASNPSVKKIKTPNSLSVFGKTLKETVVIVAGKSTEHSEV